jgi:uncharacterized Ntn-hydrolase superfamily protein
MKKIFSAALTFVILIFTAGAQDTFSIVAVDSVTGEIGSAGASCIGAPQIPQGCSIISDIHPGVGAIHTQAYYIAANQIYARGLMDDGFSPQQIIDSLVANDVQNSPGFRQYGVVDFTGAAAYTGTSCDDYKSHIVGQYYSIQGNTLLGQEVLDSMLTRFLNAPGELACRLMAALQGANVTGADNRCTDYGISSLSSFLKVAKPSDTSGTFYLDLNVKSVPGSYTIDPIDSLQTLFNAWGSCPTVGVQEIAELPFLQITPNPASGFVTFSSATAIMRIELFTITGIKLLNANCSREKNKEIDLSALDRGISLAQVTFTNGMQQKKLIVIQ